MTATEIGVEAARPQLGELADQAEKGDITYLTRRGQRIAAIVPLDRAADTGTARWDAATKTLTIEPDNGPAIAIRHERLDGYLVHALSEHGWLIPRRVMPKTLAETGIAPIVHHHEPDGQREQLDEWVAQYGQFTALVRGLPGRRIRFLIVTDPERMVMEGQCVPLELSDPNGQLFQRASRHGDEAHRLASVHDYPFKITFAEYVNGVTEESQLAHSTPGPDAGNRFDPWEPIDFGTDTQPED